MTTQTQTKPPPVQKSKPASAQPLAIIRSEVLTSKLAREYSHRKPRGIELKFAVERLFFEEQIRRNKDLTAAIRVRKVVLESFTQAFLQAASIGLSFNPTLAHCYLIPRRLRKRRNNESQKDYDDNVPFFVYASPSYRGLLSIAERGGAIKCGRAEIVHARDHFRYFGPTTKPEFEAGGKATASARFNAMTVTRGERVGAFCEAQLTDGTWLADMMDRAQIMRVIAVSEMGEKSAMYDPQKFQEEGWKKIVIRRAWKTWPKAASTPLLAHAMEILNEREGLVFEDQTAAPAVVLLSDKQVSALHAMLTEGGIENADRWLERLAQSRGFASIQELPADQFDSAKEFFRAKLEERKKVPNHDRH